MKFLGVKHEVSVAEGPPWEEFTWVNPLAVVEVIPNGADSCVLCLQDTGHNRPRSLLVRKQDLVVVSELEYAASAARGKT